ncbi:MAG: antitoxin Xre/MbcA/ParS toxin-binding domain-containing protein [Sphingomicrobium sp.]
METTRAKHKATIPSEAAVLSNAVGNAAKLWGLSNETLGKVIGVSGPTASRLRAGSWQLERGTKPFELSQYFVRLFRSLDSLMGSDDKASISWLKTQNTDLDGRPVDLILTIRGLTEVTNYIDDFRAQV